MRAWGMTRDLWWLTAALGLWGLGFGLYGVFWPLYVEQLGGSAVTVGLLSTIAGVTTALVVFPGGYFSDRVDRRALLFWGFLLGVPVPLMFAWATHWIWLLPGILLYFGSSFSTPALQAVIVNEAPGKQLATAYNVVMSVYGAGLVLGPAIGGYLATQFSFRTVLILSAGVYLVSTLSILPIKRQPPLSPVRRSPVSIRQRPRLMQWICFSAVLAMVSGMAWPFVVPYLRAVGHWSVESIGFLGSLGVLSTTLSGPIWGRLGDRLGIPRTLGYGLGLVSMGWIALLWNPGEWGWVLGSSVMRGWGEGSRGLAGVAIGRTVRMAETGTAFGLVNLVTELFGALAPLPGGFLYQRWPDGPMVFTTFFTAVLAWWLVNGLPGRPAPLPPLDLGR